MAARRAVIPLLLFCICILQRYWQWQLLAPQIAYLATFNPDRTVMQFLPLAVWREHFAAALLYLQQAPPLSNLLFGLVVRLNTDPAVRAMVLILLSGFFSALTSMLLFVLLVRLSVPRWLAIFVTLIFIGSGELLVMEYALLGQMFYEYLAMTAVMAAAYAAVALAQQPSQYRSFALGVAVAVLALSRATFSYIELPVLAWLVWRRDTRGRIFAAALLPILLLHGGWALKQWYVYGHWQWATSSWGGVNVQAGDLKRQDLRFAEWANDRKQGCATRWPGYIQHAPFGAFAFGADAAETLTQFEQSGQAMQADRAAWQARQLWVPQDSAAFGDLSQCLQHLYLQYWARFPQRAAAGWWQSYAQFWSPIDSWAAAFHFALVPAGLSSELLVAPLWERPANFLQARQYSVRQNAVAVFGVKDEGVFSAAQVIALPLLPHWCAAITCIGLHALPLIVIAAISIKIALKDLLPKGFAFLLLIYGYLAFASNLVEFGENMRFRLVVEPLGWAIALVAFAALWKIGKQLMRHRVRIPAPAR
ncbi:MAG TPA: hypothetical protein VLC91_14460 [Spongiibacteraceae bacterium]|nr:hypothetical protein [Spongiibacteraceae bacterium]